MGQARLAYSLAAWILVGAIVGAAAAIIAKQILERAGDNSMPVVYVMTMICILLIYQGTVRYFPPEASPAYHFLGSGKRFMQTVIPLTMMAVVGYSSTYLTDWLFERSGATAYGIVGAVVGGVSALLLWCIAHWFMGDFKGDKQDAQAAEN